MKNLYIIINILVVLAMVSCKQEVKTETETQTDNGLVEISKKQFQSENMKLGKVGKAEITEQLAFTGNIVPKTDGIVKISVPVPGKILSVQIKNGQHVKENETLFTIGGSELIDLQKAFASSSAKIKQLKLSYEKAKQLFDENIKTESEYLLAESDYKVELANYSALKAKLQNIGLNLGSINSGEYASHYSVKAPISGQISEINIVSGQHINTDSEIIEITDNNKTELHLNLFEKDYPKIKIGQTVQFWGIDNKTSKSLAVVSRIGSKLNANSNTFDCFASITDKTSTFVINQMINGALIISSDSVLAVPQSAVLAIGNNHYVLVKKSEDEKNYQFEKKKISTGKSSDDYIEITAIITGEILTNGTYNISIE